MRYLSVCSGIEAATCAWHPLGWEPVAFSEIEAFPSALLKQHYPDVPNFGDMTKYKEWPDAAFDVLVGGTPCQAFSVAGLRKGLDDPRGNLTLTFLGIAARYRPEWVVWENVPGVLSDQTGAFGSFVGGLAEFGYGWAYRILDAQYFGVPQRRRRVFVVGHLGGWARAAAVLFERESLSGNPAPRREAGKRIAPGASHGVDGSSDITHALDSFSAGRATEDGTGRGTPLVPDVTRPLTAAMGTKWNGNGDLESSLIPQIAGCLNSASGHAVPGNSLQDVDRGYLIPSALPDVAYCLQERDAKGSDSDTKPGHLIPVITGGGFDEVLSLQAVQTDRDMNGSGIGRGDDPMFTLTSRDQHAVAFAQNQRDEVRTMDVAGALAGEPGMKQQTYIAFSDVADPIAANQGKTYMREGSNNFRMSNVAIAPSMQVRRLTPRECERLQGFPDDYTLVQVRGKPAADGPRYKALGNSMAVPVMRWIGERIQMVNDLIEEAK